MGVRLEGPRIDWARTSGGEGGSHPSNIHDNGYALGTVNMNGDTPVILTNEGPDMGGYLCICTVATADLWVFCAVIISLHGLTSLALAGNLDSYARETPSNSCASHSTKQWRCQR